MTAGISKQMTDDTQDPFYYQWFLNFVCTFTSSGECQGMPTSDYFEISF